MFNIENMDAYSLNFENIKKHGHVFENMTLTAPRLSKTLNQLSKRCQIKKKYPTSCLGLPDGRRPMLGFNTIHMVLSFLPLCTLQL